MLPLIALVLCTPPDAYIPRPIANLIRGGHDARVIIVGDSLSNSFRGTFYDDGIDRTHFPIHAGIHNVWRPLHGWRGVNVSPADGAYKNWRGVATQGWGTQYGPRVNGSDFPDLAIGQTIDTALLGDIRSTLFTQPSELHTSIASASIGRGNLWVRHLTYDGGWQHSDSPAAPFNPDISPYITAVTGPALFGGTYFYDADSSGMNVISIAQGGDNTLDHLRTSTTFSTPTWYTSRERGYHDDGLTSWLTALESFDGTPLIILALGTNIASPDNGGTPEASANLTTPAYSSNIEALIARWRTIYPDPYFLLLSMYGFGSSPNSFVNSRASHLWSIAQNDPSRIAFINLPSSMSPFNPSWYFSPTDYHLSSAGSLHIAQIIWDAAALSVCPADLNLNNILSSDDFFLYLTWYSLSDPRADLNTSGTLTSDDFFLYLSLYSAGC